MLTDDALAAARGGVHLLVLQTAVRVVALASVAAVTRHLQPGEFGRYSTVAAVVLLAGFLADFGTSPAITRLASRTPGEADALLSGTLLGSLGLGAVAYAGAVGFAVLCYPGVTVVDVAIGALAIPGASMSSSILGAMDGEGLIARRAVATALQGLVVSAGMLPVLLGAGVRAPIIAVAAAPWVALAAAWRMARGAGFWRSRLRWDVVRTKALLRTALPFGLSGGLTALTMRFDVILLSVLRPSSETAAYDLALRLLEATAYLGTAVFGPLLFVLSRRMGDGDRDGAGRAYAQAMRVVYLLGLPLSVTFTVLARPLVSVALGPGYEAVAAPLALMGAAHWLTFVILVQGALVMGGDAVGRGIAIGGLIALVTVSLDVLLVPGLGATGAAAASALAWAFGAAALQRFHRRTHGIRTPLPPVGAVVAAAGMAVVLLSLRRAPLALPLVLGALAYAGGLVATGTVGGADVRRLQAAIAGRAR